LHQHVRRLHADADDARQQAHHRIRTLVRRLFQAAQPGPLDLLDLPPHPGEPGHVAPDPVQRVRRQRHVLRCAQPRTSLRRLAYFPLEAADAERAMVLFIPLTIRVRSPTRPSR